MAIHHRPNGTTAPAIAATITTPSTNSASKEASSATATSSRRKVRRRRSKFPEMDDVKSLIAVGLMTCFLTACVVWLGSKLLSKIVTRHSLAATHEAGQQNGQPKNHHHHAHTEESHAAANDDWDILPWNPIYQVPEAMTTLGDRSDEYARLRQKIDEILSPDTARAMARLEELNRHYNGNVGTHSMGAHHSDQVREPYDIYNCPDTPPAGYPFEWKLVDEVLNNWPVGEIDNVPDKVHNGLCIFDYENDYDKAVTYRKAELPFVVVNDPQVARAAERWSVPGYLSMLLLFL